MAERGSIILLLLFLVRVGTSATLHPQKVGQPFWEPLVFAPLPIVLTTAAVFHQDNSVMGKVYTIGGSPDDGGKMVQTNDVYRMDVATERWQQQQTTGHDFTARVYHTAVVLKHPTLNVSFVAVYGGYKNPGGAPYTSALHSDLSCCETCEPTDCPPARGGASAVVFADTTMYLYGGQGPSANALQDLWKYNIVTDEWTNQTITNQIIPARVGSAVAAISNAPTNRIAVFSGFYFEGANVQSPGNDLWLLEEAGELWTWRMLIPNGMSYSPPQRINPLYVHLSGLLFMWGGEVGLTTLLSGPMWVLNVTSQDYNEWNWTALATAPEQFQPPPLSGSGLVFIPTAGTLTLIGGATTDGSQTRSTKELYRFHALGLLPPPTRNVTGLAQPYDFTNNGTNYAFNDTSPDLSVGTDAMDADLRILFSLLAEFDESNNVVRNLSLLGINEFLVAYELLDPESGAKVTSFTRHVGFSSTNELLTVRIEFFQFPTDTLVNAVPEPNMSPHYFRVAGGSIKFNVRISNWPFVSPQNQLELVMDLRLLDIGEAAGGTYTSFGQNLLQLLSPNMQVHMEVVPVSINGNTTRNVTTTVSLADNAVKLHFRFDSFVGSLFFDPTLSVQAAPREGDDDDHIAIYIGVFVSFGVVSMLSLLALVGAMVTFVMYHYYHKRKVSQMDHCAEE